MITVDRSKLQRYRYCLTDFVEGQKVRLYIMSGTENSRVDIREGVVVNPDYSKKAAYGTVPALQINVTRGGSTLTNGKPNNNAILEEMTGKSCYSYDNIGLVKFLK